MTKLVIANWKMHADRRWFPDLVKTIAAHAFTDTEVVLCPPFPFLYEVGALCESSSVKLGAQDVSAFEEGAYTGQVSAQMLSALGCTYVLVGHSERRQYHHESSEEIVQKYLAAQSAGLQPVLCVGETLAEKEAGKTEAVIAAQLAPLVALGNLPHCVIAYEPVWAIGTGMTATPEGAQAVHAFIRTQVTADSLKILYGGSVKGDNASALFSMPDIDGGLVGGASLKASSFLEICDSAY
jgi:triosephosphate isomerase